MLVRCNTSYPPVEIMETDKGYSVMMELPGSQRDDIKVWQEDSILTITGEKKAPVGDEVFRERVFGKYSRSFSLPTDTDLEGIEANYRDGIITVDIPKLETAKPKNIEVN